MKSVLLVLLSFIFSQNIFSQTFSELKGFEDQNGNTHLFYRIYQEIKYPDQTVIDNMLYHWDLNNNVDTLFFDAYRVIPNDPLQPGYTLDIPAYDFWSLNPDKYIYSVLEMTMDPLGYIYRSDYQNPVYTDLWAPHHIYISHQDTSIVVADGGYVLRSIDGGFTWNQGAFFDFNAMSPFNDNILLGTGINKLVKSTDGGLSYYAVDTGYYWDKNYNSFYFDEDAQHIYGIYDWPYENRLTTSKIFVSNNDGEPFSWNLSTEFEGPIYFTYDSVQTGNIFIANYNSVFHSSNYGNTFSLIHHFDERLVGIYKKSGTNKLYIATRYHIYELENNTFNVLKALNANPELLKYYPLAVGDYWVYYGSIQDETGWYGYKYIRKINSLISKPNQKSYFEVEEYEFGSSYHQFLYERIDTLSAKIYRYDEDSIQTNQEYLIDDLRAEIGDSVFSHRFVYDAPYTMIYSSDTTFYGQQIKTKLYNSVFLDQYQYRLFTNFGLVSYFHSFDFGSDHQSLKGAVINGIVYGDTTVTDINDQADPGISFSLFQNYPNPFNPITTIKYSIPSTGSHLNLVSLKIFDVLGKEVAILVNEEKSAGNYYFKFDGSKLASGIYFYQLKSGSFTATKKLMLIK